MGYMCDESSTEKQRSGMNSELSEVESVSKTFISAHELLISLITKLLYYKELFHEMVALLLEISGSFLRKCFRNIYS